jgi:hypothetical protein
MQRRCRRDEGEGFVALLSCATVRAQSGDPRLTPADVEKVAGVKGVQAVGPGAVTGAGPGLNFVTPDRHMLLMVNFGTAALYQRARAQKTMTVGGTTVPMVLYHADVPGVGDEAFDSPPGPVQYVLYVRKGANSVSLSAYMSGRPPKPLLTMAQLKQLAIVVLARM